VVGRGKPFTKSPLPFIAIPTTAGTGAEVTRNAVLFVPEQKVKVSLRSHLMLPYLALVDPELTYSMPPELTATTGLDALTQLLEAFVSNKANPLTDGICREGLRLVSCSLKRAYENGNDSTARENMALASLLSGLALANSGLGAVHGLAGPIGGMFPLPHGLICASLLAPVCRVNINALQSRAPDSPALARYCEAARILTGINTAKSEDLIYWIKDICKSFNIPSLYRLGISISDNEIQTIVTKSINSSSMKGNPINLTEEELTEILLSETN
ncbi:MAG: iron-containing alcohol dehydrogenase, partial [Candidatus Sumerlaeia bacterium]|nr:iron-containing alcohol dehydrogenase [Candidatus Sumerlaeia bacterium]